MKSYITTTYNNPFLLTPAAYKQTTDAIIDQATQQIKTAVANHESLTELFHQMIKNMAHKQTELANQAKLDKAHLYGLRRDKNPFQGTCSISWIQTKQQDYHKKALLKLVDYLQPIQRTKMQILQTKHQVQFEPCLGRASSIQFEIFNPESNNLFSFNQAIDPTNSIDLYLKLCELGEIEPEHRDNPDLGIALFSKNIEALKRLKMNNPTFYKKLKLQASAFEAKREYPLKLQSDWILATNRLQIGDKMYAISQYLTWAYRDLVNDPIDKMTERSIVMVLPQDPFLIDPLLQEIARIFDKTLKSNGNHLPTLQAYIAEMKYLLDHTSPFHLQSYEISKWIELTVYRYFGYDIEYVSGKNSFLEALTSSPKEFVDNYPSTVNVIGS